MTGQNGGYERLTFSTACACLCMSHCEVSVISYLPDSMSCLSCSTKRYLQKKSGYTVINLKKSKSVKSQIF